jgi:hypothetical protein
MTTATVRETEAEAFIVGQAIGFAATTGSS